MTKTKSSIQAIIGLGNPGQSYYYQRHSIGFRVLDELAQKYSATWHARDSMEYAKISINDHHLLLIKPQTFMNSSGKVIPYLTKQGIKAENIMVVHDELELPFGKIATKMGGSAKGHNGLKSLIAARGDGFMRLRFGIGRPADKEEVPEYVLSHFSENSMALDQAIVQAVEIIEEQFIKQNTM